MNKQNPNFNAYDEAVESISLHETQEQVEARADAYEDVRSITSDTRSEAQEALDVVIEGSPAQMEKIKTLDPSEIRAFLKQAAMVGGVVLAPMLISSCEKSIVNPNGEIISPIIKYNEYNVVPKPGDVYFILPDGTKVVVDNIVQFDIKENLNSGSKEIKFVFDGTLLKKTLNEVFSTMKTSYPNGKYGIVLRFSKVGSNGVISKLTSSFTFIQTKDQFVTAVGLDEIKEGVKYSFEDLVKIAGGIIINEAGTNTLSKGEKIQGTIGGYVENKDYKGYTPKTNIIFEL